jgi:dCTP deaminase
VAFARGYPTKCSLLHDEAGMVLSDVGIKRAIASGALEIDPPPSDEQYQSSAVNIYLGDQFRIWDPSRFRTRGIRIDLNLADQSFQDIANQYAIDAPRESDRSVVLPPFAVEPTVLLCSTRERIHLKRESALCARVEGRSSFARIGLAVHLTAPTIHAGYNGPITLEVVNHGRFYLRFVPNSTMICQFIIEQLDGPATGVASATFQGQTTPVGRPPESRRS